MFGLFKKKLIPRKPLYETKTEIHKFPAAKVKFTFLGKLGEVKEYFETLEYTKSNFGTFADSSLEYRISEFDINNLISELLYLRQNYMEASKEYICDGYYTLGTISILEEYETEIEVQVTREVK